MPESKNPPALEGVEKFYCVGSHIADIPLYGLGLFRSGISGIVTWCGEKCNVLQHLPWSCCAL